MIMFVLEKKIDLLISHCFLSLLYQIMASDNNVCTNSVSHWSIGDRYLRGDGPGTHLLKALESYRCNPELTMRFIIPLEQWLTNEYTLQKKCDHLKRQMDT